MTQGSSTRLVRSIPGAIEWLDALSAPQPSPAGGSAVALVGATRIGLLIELAHLSRTVGVVYRDESMAHCTAPRDRLISLAEADAPAMKAFVAARRLSRDDPARLAALEAVVNIPLEADEICHSVIEEVQLLFSSSQSQPCPMA